MTIIEVMVPSALLLIVVTAVLTGVYSGLRLQSTARQRATATDWADHLMELARNQNYDAIGLSATSTATQAAIAAVPAGDTDNPDLLVRRAAESNCLELNTGTSASPSWERLVLADWYTLPAAAANCATQTTNPDFHLVHAGGANDYTPAGTPAVTYSGWMFVTWAPVDGQPGVYYKRVTVMVRFPSPTGGVSRLVRTSSLFGLGYVPSPSSSSTSTTTSSSTTTTLAAAATTTLAPGCAVKAGDVQGPTGTIALAGGAGYTNQTSLAINNSVEDLPNGSGASGMATMQYSNTGPTGPWQPNPAGAYSALDSGWTIPAGDGTKQVWGRFTECNGNASTAVITDTVVLDQTAPPAPSVSGTPRNNRIDLDWTTVSDPGASASGIASYRVFRLDLGTTTPIGVVTGTSYNDNGLTAGRATPTGSSPSTVPGTRARSPTTTPEPRPSMAGQRRAGDEHGFTIAELVVTSAILLVVVTAAMSLLTAAQRSTSFSTRRGKTQDAVRLAMDRLTKDMRQLTRFNTSWPAGGGSWTGRDLDFRTYTVASPTTPVRVRWWVSGTTLNRQEWRADGTSPGPVAILGSVTAPGAGVPDLFYCDVLQGSDAATGTPVPWQMTVTLTVDLANPGGTYSTQSQVQFRNLQIPQPA